VQQGAGGLEPQIVSVHRDVERSDRDVDPLDGGDLGADPLGERDAAARDAEQHEVAGALVALEDLVGDAGEGPGDVTGVEDGASRLGDGLGLRGRHGRR
jgi:hypothetical protein